MFRTCSQTLLTTLYSLWPFCDGGLCEIPSLDCLGERDGGIEDSDDQFIHLINLSPTRFPISCKSLW
jgi:hypothetical protein